ncbi:hypothetical protein ACFSTC_58810 [Nonomuraea ferruginea]
MLRSLPHRWPTLAGLAFAAFSGLNMGDARDEGMVVFLAALVYLATAVIGKPGVVWTLFCMSVVGGDGAAAVRPGRVAGAGRERRHPGRARPGQRHAGRARAQG